MSFDSPIYFIFLAVVVAAYWRLSWRAQNLWLVGASYLFYGWWDWRFLFLMAASTLLDYFLARWIDAAPTTARRKACLTLSLVINFGFLGFFKYFNFFADNIGYLARYTGHEQWVLPVVQVVLPAGISFYTFQAVAYIVDVYHRKMEPARNLLDYALFISFFPHLVAGPIQRPSHLLPQAQAPRRFNPDQAFDGLMLIVTGLFRKCVIADNCALLANAVFAGNFGAPNTAVVLLGVYAFAWQIYGDFSGYSDIARGSAKLMGFEFMVNFRQPYLAATLSEFWRRWHISLSTWLRDYLYIPLGGNRQGETKTRRNMLVTMVLGGFWHGANWTFVVWGFLHGAGLALGRMFPRRGATDAAAGSTAEGVGRAGLWAKRIFVFHLVCLGWLFFRAESLTSAGAMLRGLLHFRWEPSYLTAVIFLCAFSLPFSLSI